MNFISPSPLLLCALDRRLSLLRKQPAQELQAVLRQRVLRRFERSPYRGGPGNRFHLAGERLDDHRAVVARVLHGGGDFLPWHVPGSWRAAIVLAAVQVLEPAAGRADRVAYRLLF